MAERKKKGSGRKSTEAQGGRRISGYVAMIVVAVALLALPTYRFWVGMRERNPVAKGLGMLDSSGCLGCHRALDGSVRWRADGVAPASMSVIRDAVLGGAPAVPGFAAEMPAYRDRFDAAHWSAIVSAVGAMSGHLGVPEDPELAAGYDLAKQLECFTCHGPIGAGGTPNPGSIVGIVPGFYGDRFIALAGDEAGVARLLREGVRPVTVPLTAGPALVMPSYGDRLDSTEEDLLARYVLWLRSERPSFP